MKASFSVLMIAGVMCLLALGAAAAPAKDEVTALPGFSGTLPSKQYSGLVDVSESGTAGRFLHYWFVESENDPANDPVVLWMNGGPGCSSMDGYFYEQGPLHFAASNVTRLESGETVPSLVLNPNRWNKIANMIFLEAPAGVGFSYSENPNDYNTNDNKTADDNYRFLERFFQAPLFPEYASNDVYISGESYAGIYVPTLVYRVLQHQEAGAPHTPNLKGFMVGNGCIGNSVGACSAQGTQISIDFLFGHGMYSQKLKTQIDKECTTPTDPSSECIKLLEQMGDEVGPTNIYDVYAPCINGGSAEGRRYLSKLSFDTRITRDDVRRRIPERPLDKFLAKRFFGLGGPDECIDGIQAAAYLNNAQVRQAIHVPDATVIPRWSVCTSKLNYDSNTVSLLPIYPTLIKNYRTLIYNGNVDACVPYIGNEHWTSTLGFEATKSWHPWTVNNQVAGYATNYANNNDFAFVTVHGSGHMVPQFRPPQAFNMFQRFINQQPF